MNSRRRFLQLSAGAALAVARFGGVGATCRALGDESARPPSDIHQELLDIAAAQEAERQKRFAAAKSPAGLVELQHSLRKKFWRLIGGMPQGANDPPTVTKTGEIDGGDYTIDKLVYESFPGYFVSALLYRPKSGAGRLPAILGPCGHSPAGKAEPSYQILHVNLARRGYIVLTNDPVGQAERSQFWDPAKHASRFNLTCGEHAVLGNPLYLLGSSLARFRIWDGIRGLDYLASRPDVDPKKLGCVGSAGGGTLTAYISALDERVLAAAPCCYITTLRRRMANRIQTDPDADPEQDIFGFVSEGIDHAGLLAMRAPRPTLLGTATFDFFPIEGARESFAEAQRLYDVAGAGDRMERVEAAERHGMTKPLRQAVYAFFDRWLGGRQKDVRADELPVTPRPTKELLVCADGQVNLTFHSRPLLALALEEFDRRDKPIRAPLDELLRIEHDRPAPLVEEISAGPTKSATTLLLVNGNEAPDWRDEKKLLAAIADKYRVLLADPRGVGKQRVNITIPGRPYTDPLAGVEENIAYNAFLTGRSLVAMRVSDVRDVVRRLKVDWPSGQVIIIGRGDAALVAFCAAAVEPSIDAVAVEDQRFSFHELFAEGKPINAASIVPGLLSRFGDMGQLRDAIAPRRMFIAVSGDPPKISGHTHTTVGHRFTTDPQRLIDWLQTR